MSHANVRLEEGLLIKSLPLYSEAVVAATLIQTGDLLRFEADSTATNSGVGLFDTASEFAKFCGASKGGTTTDMTSGAYGTKIPVVLRGVIECPLASANYNFGQPLGYSGTKNTLTAAVTSSGPFTIGWFYGSDQDAITKGLVLIDVPLLSTLFSVIVS
jgi:hypothetical protein